MQEIVSNHWYCMDNRLVISFICYYVEIKPIINDSNIKYKLRVGSDIDDEICLYFDTLEDAMCFAENVISKNHSRDVSELFSIYQGFRKEKVLKKM